MQVAIHLPYGFNRREIRMSFDIEYTIMQLIMHAGDARSLAIEAIREARNGNLTKSDSLIQECQEKMLEAHTHQSKLIFSESNGNAIHASLLLIHAQDHVMNALTMKDIAIEIIETIKELRKG